MVDRRTLPKIYKDLNAVIPDRVQDLVGRMTAEEKVAQLKNGWMLPRREAICGLSEG
jgi:hypothetical protein